MSRPLSRRSARVLVASMAALLAIAVGVAVVAAIGFDRRPPTAGAQVQSSELAHGVRAPSFTLPRLGGGAPVSLAAFSGRPVVLNFFASWCPDCKSELDAFAAAWRDLGGRVSFLAIDTNDSDPSAAGQLLATAGDRYPAAEDPYAAVAQQYLVTGLPMTVFLDRTGRVVNVVLGAEDAAQVEHWANVAASR